MGLSEHKTSEELQQMIDHLLDEIEEYREAVAFFDQLILNYRASGTWPNRQEIGYFRMVAAQDRINLTSRRVTEAINALIPARAGMGVLLQITYSPTRLREQAGAGHVKGVSSSI